MSAPKNMTPEQVRVWKAKEAARLKKWREENPEKFQAQTRRRRQADPEKTRRLRHESYLRNKEKEAEKAKAWREANKDQRRALCREWARKNRLENPEKVKSSARDHYVRNRARLIKEAQRRNDPERANELRRKRYSETKVQDSADQFFILAAAAEQISKIPQS